MTREEAIDCLKGLKIYLKTEHIDQEAIDMAIEALSADTISREAYHNLVTASNDIDRALREYQDKEENGELLSVVRCKDCRHAYYADNRVPHEKTWVCERFMNEEITSNDFCSWGERKGGDSE